MSDELMYEVVELLGKTALFTEVRINDNYVPKGLHKYELREGDGNEFYFATLERHVLFNLAGTILVAEQIDLGTDGYISFDDLPEDDYPGFDGREMTISEYCSKYLVKKD